MNKIVEWIHRGEDLVLGSPRELTVALAPIEIKALLEDRQKGKVLKVLRNRRVATFNQLVAQTLIDPEALTNDLNFLHKKQLVDSPRKNLFMLSDIGDLVSRLV